MQMGNMLDRYLLDLVVLASENTTQIVNAGLQTLVLCWYLWEYMKDL